MECYKLVGGIVLGAVMMWKAETLWQLMAYCLVLRNMIVEDEGEGAARMHDFDKARVHVRLPKQEAGHIQTFWRCIDNFDITSVHATSR